MASIDEFHIAGTSSIDELKYVGQIDSLKIAGKTETQLHVKPIEEYFGEMELTDAEVEKRIKTAKSLEMAYLFFFALLLMLLSEGEEPTEEELTEYLSTKYKECLKSVEIDLLLGYNYLSATITQIIERVVKSTLRNLSDKFFTSNDRAKILAEEDSNSIHNNIQFHRAMIGGATTKQWLTMKDRKVRHSHVMIDDTVVGINEKFVVGNSLMLYPRDTSADGCEIANCRCVLVYRKNGKIIEDDAKEKTFVSDIDDLTIR